MKKNTFFILASIAVLAFVTPLKAATCTGDADCRACKNCRYCKHCAKEGGTCGVCARSTKEEKIGDAKAGTGSCCDEKPGAK